MGDLGVWEIQEVWELGIPAGLEVYKYWGSRGLRVQWCRRFCGCGCLGV